MGVAILEVKYFNTFVVKKIGIRGLKKYTLRPEPNYDPTAPFPIVDSAAPVGNWFGFPWDPVGYPEFPDFYTLQGLGTWWLAINNGWQIEESRIKGGYNNDMVGMGVKAHLVDKDAKSLKRKSSLIYSGTLNNRTGVNMTNVFNVGEDITRTVTPEYGHIQTIFADDGNLLILQENKVSQALIDKDAVYTAEGGQMTTAGNVVIGPINAYGGNYGVSSNPESFTSYGYRKYFSDKSRGAIMRLSKDGMTEVSEYGMFDYFRDELGKVNYEEKRYDIQWIGNLSYFDANNVAVGVGGVAKYVVIEKDPQDLFAHLESGMGVVNSTGFQSGVYVTQINEYSQTEFKVTFNSNGLTVSSSNDFNSIIFQTSKKDRVVGGWDTNNKCYTVSLQCWGIETEMIDSQSLSQAQAVKISYQTLNYDEKVRGWVSRFSFYPDQMFSIKNKFYSTRTINPIGNGSVMDKALFSHYSTTSNRGEFYRETSDSTITTILNANPSIVKNFKTINYEGSNGWEMTSMYSSSTGSDNTSLSYDPNNPATINEVDSAIPVKSFYEGAFTVEEQPAPNPPIITEFPTVLPPNIPIVRGGFDRKENKYVSNLKNSSSPRPGEVVFGRSTSGVKGYYSTVTLKTDSTTNYGGPKELFSIGSEFVVSST